MGLAIGQPAKQRRSHINGGRTFDIYSVTFDSSYPTGGESLVAADLEELRAAWPQGPAQWQWSPGTGQPRSSEWAQSSPLLRQRRRCSALPRTE